MTDTKQTRVIALYSPAPRSGKTTAAHYLAETRDAAIVSFADPLRDAVHSLLLRSGAKLTDKDAPLPTLGGASERDLMIAIGQAARSVYPNFWVDTAERTMLRHLDKFPLVVIDDLRLPNEYAMLRRHGACIALITRPSCVLSPSETEGRLSASTFDVGIVNDKETIEGYYADLSAALAPWLPPLGRR